MRTRKKADSSHMLPGGKNPLVILTLLAGFAGGCGKADALLVVDANSAMPLKRVVALTGVISAGGKTAPLNVIEFAQNGPISIPPNIKIPIYIPPQYAVEGNARVIMTARAPNGAALANGDTVGMVAAGVRHDTSMVLERIVCSKGLAYCDGLGCIDTASDPANCGACEQACKQGEVCNGGACAPNCGGLTNCSGACVDKQTNPVHCGACGHVCPTGADCTGGACSCPVGKSECGGTCVDTQTDNGNCGACGHVCPFDATCTGGVCACKDGKSLCGGVCVDTASDPANCGACEQACKQGEVCNGGACAPNCGGLTNCSGACVDTQMNNANCGACGNACPVGPSAPSVCAGGACTCPMGKKLCGNACVDTTTDLVNCGACGKACPVGPNSQAVCSASKCGLTCFGGWADCNGQPGDGCEVKITDDIGNCGACGNVCAMAPNATPACKVGMCGLACNPGFANCDFQNANGCEVDTENDPQNCGGCAKACPGGGAPHTIATCKVHVCGVSCTQGFADCDGNPLNGCEKDVTSDVLNCGACGKVCPPGFACTAGGCNRPYAFGDCPADNTNPPVKSCKEACAAFFGGQPGDYICSTDAGGLNKGHAWGHGYKNLDYTPAGCGGVGNATQLDTYKFGTNFDCGVKDCSWSAYVSSGCPAVQNWCWK